MTNKRRHLVHTGEVSDPYTLGYHAGFTGKPHTLNPYPKNIPDSVYNSRKDHIPTFLNTPDLAPNTGSSGVTEYHQWFSGWNDGVDSSENAAA
jgi:ribosome modulation factor